MADFNLFPGQQPLTGLSALLYGNQQPQGGLGGFQQNTQSPLALALSQQAPAPSGGWEPGGQLPAGMPQVTPHKRASGVGRIFGAIGDAMASFGGKDPLFYQSEQKAADDERQQQATLTQLLQKRWLQQNYPEPTAEQQNWEYYKTHPDEQPMIDKYRTQSAPRFVIDPSGQGGFVSPGGAAPAASTAPPVGYVWQGKRFKGGDYNNVTNWEDVGGAAVPPQTGFPGSR